jgi:ATP-dependent DNA helicase RecG
MTAEGSLDISVIDELPPGRTPVTTAVFPEGRREEIALRVRERCLEGAQAYWVCTLVEESEVLECESAETTAEYLQGLMPDVKVGLVHGRMSPQEKDEVMSAFKGGEIGLLVATTVIEVGVNVPNATVMMIQNAERFGLSQLHQLRGRVGRGGDQSYCLLLTDLELSKETRKRMDIMVATNDGFRIAEADLQLRGPGDLQGTLQSGTPFELHIANLATDGQRVTLARQAALEILDPDPLLEDERNRIYKRRLDTLRIEAHNWSEIS